MSWISLDDAICAIHHVMLNSTVEGPINIASPNTVTNEEFTRQLGATLNRPTVATIPAFIIKIMFGQMGKETILASTRVIPPSYRKADTRTYFHILRKH
ncbi:MAG: hypothetical protein CM1200mP15_04500 [Dehalococcoidia bacterium]|nr:MAG: hypothetical protein CM1200mP15_04500 [Dehalococcoidia bacterium]